jgi:putative hydrolase of the HAD superfamily
MSEGYAYDAVCWDIGGVIVELKSVREGYAAFVSELADEYGLDAEAALETWRSRLGKHFKSREGTEYASARDGYRKASAALFPGGEAPPEEEWWPVFRRANEAHLRAEPGAVETIRALDDAGIHLGIVSDIDANEADSFLGGFGIAECFDAVTTSEAVGHTKPDRRMFEDAISKLPDGVAPDETLMIGDRYRHDVEGAADAGLVPVAYHEDADGPKAAHRIDDLRELLDVVGLGTDYVDKG